MSDGVLSFLTPYWSGRQMMRLHLGSIRRFHPQAPILISKRGGDLEEMEAHREEFGIRYWIEDRSYVGALLKLLERCETEYACILDHDTVLLSALDPFVSDLAAGRYDLLGVEERILVPEGNRWLRFAPGYMDATILMFNLREFLRQWGLRGVKWKRTSGTWHTEYHYGICQKLKRHKYLLPFHTRKYGLGNLLKDGDTAVLWHQWYGSYRHRFSRGTDSGPPADELQKPESAFLDDYPNLDLSGLTPAWGPGWDLRAEQMAAAKANPRTGLRGWMALGIEKLRQIRRGGA